MDKCTSFIQNLVCPAICLFCGEPGIQPNDLCHHCHDALPWLEEHCNRCGISLPIEAAECGECLKNPPPYNRTISLMRYEERSRHLVTSLKFAESYPASRLMGNLMAEQLLNVGELPELLIPVPLHPARYRSRGFNQAIEIARPISATLKVPIANGIVKRVINTPSQSKLHAKERHKNLRRAFQLKRKIEAKHIAIVDDVITTGSTVTELAKLLRKSGVQRIDVWSFARA